MDYVAGFLFNEDQDLVVLIEKNKPDWQKGKLNAIGGKIESGEHPADAMRREFLEETGVDIPTWKIFTSLVGDGFCVHFYYAIANSTVLLQTRSITDETVEIYWLKSSDNWNCIPNLCWLIPMALSIANKTEPVSMFYVSELKKPEECTCGGICGPA